MKKITNILFFFYQIFVKIVLAVFSIKSGPTCRFYPTCSDYARQSFKKDGFLKGFLKTTRRISRCHPWNKGGIDLP